MNTTAKRLSGKTALITDGNSGIGLATARRTSLPGRVSSGVQEFKEFKEFITPGDSETVLKEGAYVFITGRRDPELAAGRKRFR